MFMGHWRVRGIFWSALVGVAGWAVGIMVQSLSWLPYIVLPVALALMAILGVGELLLWMRSREAVPPATPEPSLRGGFALKPDTPLVDALFFAATGVWGGRPDTSYGLLNGLTKAISDFHQIAADGHVRVWSRSYNGDGVWEQLAPTAWVHNNISIQDVLRGEATLRRRHDGAASESCFDLRVCREQMEAHWPYYRSLLT